MKFRKQYSGRKDDKCYIIPIVFYNLKGNDSHIIIKHLTKFYAPNDVNVIAMTLENAYPLR